jgi:hypothetical protein
MAQPPDVKAMQRSVISASPIFTVFRSKGCNARVGHASTHLLQNVQLPMWYFITGVREAIRLSSM